jgi:hypothetical protein
MVLTPLAAGLALAGCAHNDVLVFGTSTTVGLNIQTAATQGAAPSIVLGYEREEAVWMPLLVNGRDMRNNFCLVDQRGQCTAGAATVPIDSALYRSTSTVGNRVTTDAYSVFASLGAKFGGKANTGAEANGGLAQFFATGNAALNISSNEALVTALKVESGEGARAQATAVAAAAAGNATVASVRAGMTPADIATANSAGVVVRNQHQRKVDLVMLCVAKPDGTLRWGDLVDALPGYSAPQIAGLKQSTTRADIRARLAGSDVLTDDVLAAAGLAPFSCATS